MSPTAPVRAIAWRVRVEPAAWLFPVSLVIGYLAATGDVRQSPGYPLALAVRGHGCLLALAPLGAGACAWKASRHRRAGWTRRRWARSASRLTTSEVAMTAAVQFTAYLLIVLAVSVVEASSVQLDLWLAAVAIAVLAAATALGYLAGSVVRAEMALPLSVVVIYGALVAPLALEPLWLRHLTGIYGVCCADDAQLAPGALRAPLAIGGGTLAAVLVLVEVRSRLRLVPVGLALLVASIWFAVGQVSGLGADPIAPRRTPVRCASGRPDICVWPEQAGDLAEVVRETGRAARRWTAAGLAVPNRITVGRGPGEPGTVARLVLPPDPTAADIRLALAFALVPIDSSCPDPAANVLAPARALLWADVAVISGAAPDVALEQIGADRGDDLRRLRASSPSAHRRWISEVERASAACSTTAPTLPS